MTGYPEFDGAVMMCQQTDPDLFTPGKGEPAEPAKRLCRQCAFIEPCLEYALTNDVGAGIYGGTTNSERRAMRKGKPVKLTRSPRPWTDELTKRLILSLIDRGWKNGEVAREVGVSERTVIRIAVANRRAA